MLRLQYTQTLMALLQQQYVQAVHYVQQHQNPLQQQMVQPQYQQQVAKPHIHIKEDTVEGLDSGEEEISAMEEDEVVHQYSVKTVGHLATIRGIIPICNVYNMQWMIILLKISLS